jgi:4-hydroxy-3-polyprenylbenzoate decarboxylase
LNYRNLQEYIAALEKSGELVRVKARVSPELEITEIASRLVKSGGPAALFENVEGSEFPVFIGGFASERRMAKALGLENMAALSKKVEDLLAIADIKPGSMMEKLRLLPKLSEIASYLPKTVSKAPCQEVVLEDDAVDLETLPVLKCWPLDGGRFFTLPLVFTKNPDTGAQNMGMYRMQVFNKRTTGMHWHRHKDGARHYEMYERRNERMEVAVAVGADPATVFASTVPLPEEMDEMALAGFIRGEGVKMVKARSVDILVPAEAEFVLEGYVEPKERRMEGPFGDHTGFYSLPDEYPVFHVTCMTRRKKPVYHATVVGKPPMEDCYMALAVEQMFLPILKKMHPEAADFHMPFEGVFHNLVFISINKRYPGQARKLMHALWGAGQAQFSKVIVVVDSDVDLRDYSTLAWKVLNNIDPQRDFEFATGAVDVLDHASRAPGYGSKVGIDATRKLPEEGFSRPWPDELKMAEQIVSQVARRWKEYGF